MHRPWPGPQEHDLIPYQALDDWGIASLLVVAPHPDDEVFGCGGLLALAARRGLRCQVAIATDGALAGDAAVREAESLAAAAVLGGAGVGPAIEFWRLPDRGLRPDAALSRRVGQAAIACTADWVLVPSPFEVHVDHRAVCLAAIDAVADLQAQGRAARLVFYEVGQPLIPNALIDITPVVDQKARAVACFASQLALQAYGDQVAGLNRQRSYTLGPAVSHAEALWLVSPQELAGGVEGVMAGFTRQLRRRL